MTEQEALSLVNQLLQATNRGQQLNDVQSVVFLATWAGSSYPEIAKTLGYECDYIKQVGSRLWRSLSQAVGEPVCKGNIKTVLCRYQQARQFSGDWEGVIDARSCDRQQELQTLKRWILGDRCRLIGIFGLGGMGKTTLSIKLARQMQSQFEYVIWRSLQHSPPLNALIADILPILTPNETAEVSINRLIVQLRATRCLLCLDRVESILQRGGQYRSGYEDYRYLCDRISDEPHQSCLVMTGRQKPADFALREGKIPTTLVAV